jgi:hypothetical protein
MKPRPSPREDETESVGNERILKSPDVEAAPSNVNRPIPVPSVYIDERGEIHNFRIHDKRINLIYSRKGVMRSGDIHKNSQHDFVFSGKVEVKTLSSDGSTTSQLYGPYTYIHIPPYVPHIFNFVDDTIMAEWWEPEPFYSWYYLPYRKTVQDSFIAKTPGIFQHLVAVKESNELRSMKLVGAGVGLLALGVAVGFALGRPR